MHWVDHVIMKIAEAECVLLPWTYIKVKDIFPEDFYDAIQSNLPALKDMQPLSWKTQQRHLLNLHDKGEDNLSAPKFWQDLRDRLFPTLRAALEERFQLIGSSIASAVVYDEPGYELVPHTDMAHRLITAVFYIPPDYSTVNQGTVIMRGSKADPVGIDHKFDGSFETVATIPYLPNSAIFFPRTNWSYHGVRRTDRPRWTFSFDVLR
jgi:hypothetical protein